MDARETTDTPALRKTRGAFFTPDPITRFMCEWALMNPDDKVLEPSAGEAAFMVAAATRLQALGRPKPVLHGVEIHEESAAVGRERVIAAGGSPDIAVQDFFDVTADGSYDAVVGNPPYIRYQSFTGSSRAKARAAALRAGVRLSGLASSWAAFTVHAAQFLKPGGKLGLVLPAELLTVNYAAPVRRFLFDSFRDVSLVMFAEQVFPDAEADVVLLLADGFGEGPTDHAVFRQTTNASSLGAVSDTSLTWRPTDVMEKWTGNLVDPDALTTLKVAEDTGKLTGLTSWGRTSLGTVTGANKFFALTPARVRELGLSEEDTLPMSPPGSSHLRGLRLTRQDLERLGDQGKATRLFCPPEVHSSAAEAYIRAGMRTDVHNAYKCRTRKVWYRPPVTAAADLFLTYMNADTVRLTSNESGARHLNSVHGVYLNEEDRDIGRELLPLASLNSLTLLHAELIGRSYGGGILKMEPREADRWLLPSPDTVLRCRTALRALRSGVETSLASGDLLSAVDLVDAVLGEELGLQPDKLALVRQARDLLATRRSVRGSTRRHTNK